MTSTNQQHSANFEKLLEQNYGIISKVARSYCYCLTDQQDLMQEIALQIWRSYSRYDRKFKFSTWIYRIALNVAISHVRKSTNHKNFHQPLDEAAENVPDTRQQVHLYENEQVKLLWQFIGQLNVMNKALMILYLDGLSHQEIADILDISTSNVATKIGRIKQQLTDYFNQEQRDE